MRYTVEVRYRTNSGCNVRRVPVDADNMPEAMQQASDRVRKQRGVIRIDGCDCEIPFAARENNQ